MLLYMFFFISDYVLFRLILFLLKYLSICCSKFCGILWSYVMNFLWKFLNLVCNVRFYTCNPCMIFGAWCYEVCSANIMRIKCELSTTTPSILVSCTWSYALSISVFQDMKREGVGMRLKQVYKRLISHKMMLFSPWFSSRRMESAKHWL